MVQTRLCLAGRRRSCAAGCITVQCCPKWWSCTGTRLMTAVVTSRSWGSSPTPGSAKAPAALHCTGGMELKCQGSERSRSSVFQWGNWGMEGLLSPTSSSGTAMPQLMPSLVLPQSNSSPAVLPAFSLNCKILFPSNPENITRRVLLLTLDLWNPFYQNRSISCFKLLHNFPFKVA